MSSEKLDQLFAQELALYSDLEKLIAEYIQPLQSDLLHLGSGLFALKSELLSKLQQKQQEIAKKHQEQIQAMRLFCKDTIFEKNYPLFFKFVSQCLDFSNLPPPSDIQYLCYLSIYKLLSTATGTALISYVYHHLTVIKQKIMFYSTEDESMGIKKFEFYHPNLNRCMHLYASAGKQSTLIPQPIFILFGHELIHLLHHLLDFSFHPKESSRYFRFELSNPKSWLYTGAFKEPELFATPYEYITIEGRSDLLNGLCENRLRAAYKLPSRESWRAVKIEYGNAKLQQYFFLAKKSAENKSLSFKEIEELRFSNADGTLAAFFQRTKKEVKTIEPMVEALENSSTCSSCSIL